MAKLSPKERAEILAMATGQAPVKKKRSASSYREFQEQALFAQRLRLDRRTRDLPWTATMQGINLPPLQAKLAKAKGVQRGVPDFLCFVRRATYTGLALEFKDPEGRGKIKPEQQVWARLLTEQGWLVLHPETATEGWQMLTSYMGMKE